MIFKLLVVDDEATMRKGIANFMNWETIDCTVTATACDGLEAIEILKKEPVDIIITDIKMPMADGLEIARYVHENHLDIKVILLTGYADFEYAQTAIRYNVSSFILKPANKKALFEAVQEAQKELIVSKKNSSIAKEELAFLKDQLLQELTDQHYTEKFKDRLIDLGLSLEYYCVAAFQPLSQTADISALKQIIIEEKRSAYCYRYNNLIISVYFLDDISSPAIFPIPDDILTNCREIAQIARIAMESDVTAGISNLHHSPEEFGTAVSEAIYSLSFHFYSESSLSLFCDAPDTENYDLTAESSINLFQFENAMNNWEFEKARNILLNIFMKFKSNLTHSNDAKNICSQIYYICSRVLIKKELPAPATEYLNQLHQAPDIFVLEQRSLDLMADTQNLLLAWSGSQNKLVSNAAQYIQAHLASALSLETIAEQLHISASHLSRTFKKVRGESLTEYINNCRIEKAKEYLTTTDTLTYAIAELVGYNDPAYFSAIFKKHTGISPTEYREKKLGLLQNNF